MEILAQLIMEHSASLKIIPHAMLMLELFATLLILLVDAISTFLTPSPA
jgi:hypothetical protein